MLTVFDYVPSSVAVVGVRSGIVATDPQLGGAKIRYDIEVFADDAASTWRLCGPFLVVSACIALSEPRHVQAAVTSHGRRTDGILNSMPCVRRCARGGQGRAWPSWGWWSS